MTEREVRWRVDGPYLPNISSKTGLLEESTRALRLYGGLRNTAATRRALLDGALPQRSRETRKTIVETIGRRLVGWNPPQWVCSDLVEAACGQGETDLQALLLLHLARQDRLLYDVVQRVIVPRWWEGQLEVRRADVQRLLDEAAPEQPQIERWTHATREKVAGNALSILRDYGLMRGTAVKRIVEPVISPFAVRHLARLLRAEGIAEGEIADHPDWKLWLWTPARARAALQQEGRDG